MSAERLSAYDALLADSFVMKDLKTWRRAGEFLQARPVFALYPELIEEPHGEHLPVGRPAEANGSPGSAWTSCKGRVTLRQLLKDGIAAGRSYL